MVVKEFYEIAAHWAHWAGSAFLNKHRVQIRLSPAMDSRHNQFKEKGDFN